MTKRPRLLAVCNGSPWPRRGGFSLRAADLLEALSRQWDISVVVAHAEGEIEWPWQAGEPHRLVVVRVPGPLATPSRPAPTFEIDSLVDAVADEVKNYQARACLLFNGTECLVLRAHSLPGVVCDRN